MKSPIIIYHADCNDGFTAAWIANKALDAVGFTPPAELCPQHYNDPVPYVDDRLVYILDFSFKRPVMEDILRRCEHLVWIDHHATAIAECGDLLTSGGKMEGIADARRCGAWLTWEWFYGPDAIPDLVKLVDDRDRWVFQYPHTRYVHQGLNLRQYTTEAWDEASTNIVGLIADGKPVEDLHWDEIRAKLDKRTVTKIIAGNPVPCAMMEYSSASDSCQELLARFPAAKFACTYFDREGRRTYSLRSRNNEDVDVGAVAKQFGGGGHKHAAGFALDAELDKGVLNP